MAATNRERVAKHAAARQAAGGRRVTVWLTAEDARNLSILTHYGCSVTGAISEALRRAVKQCDPNVVAKHDR